MGRFKLPSYEDGVRFGFNWGGPQQEPDGKTVRLVVTRLFAVRARPNQGKYRALEISTDHARIQVHVSPGGRSIRCFVHDPDLGVAEMEVGEWKTHH